MFDVAPHECSFVVLSLAKVTTGISLSHQLSCELLPCPSSHRDIPSPGFSVFWCVCLAQKAPFPLPVGRGPPFSTATPEHKFLYSL